MGKKARRAAVLAVALVVLGIAVVATDYLGLLGSTADCRDCCMMLPLGGFACIDGETRLPIADVEMTVSDAAGFQTTRSSVISGRPGMAVLGWRFVPGSAETRLFRFRKRLTPTMICHFHHPDYESASVKIVKPKSPAPDLSAPSPRVVVMKPRRTR